MDGGARYRSSGFLAPPWVGSGDAYFSGNAALGTCSVPAEKVLYRQRGPALAGFDPVLVEVQHGLDALHAGAADAGKQVAAQTPDVAAGAWGRIWFWKSAKWRV
jgi:hypothetical protein